jgi:hypothetical protein
MTEYSKGLCAFLASIDASVFEMTKFTYGVKNIINILHILSAKPKAMKFERLVNLTSKSGKHRPSDDFIRLFVNT